MKGFATASFPSAIFNGKAGRRRGDGPLTTLGPFLRIVDRVMTRAFEQPPVGVPVGDVAAGMRAYSRVADDTFCSALLGLGVEPFGVETQQQHLVEPRTVADGLGLRIHRPSQGLLAVDRKVVRFQRFWISRGAHRDQQVAFAGPFVRGFGLRDRQPRRKREAEAELDRRPPPDQAATIVAFLVHPSSRQRSCYHMRRAIAFAAL